MRLRIFGYLALLAMLFVPAFVRADVKDNANIFSKQAVDDANRDMRKMKQTHNKEFVVETFAAIPDDQKDAYAQNKETFFRTWMANRAKELKVNGVYVLICMDPKHLEAGAGKNTRERGEFTQTDLDSLTTQMRASLRDKQNDKALTDAVDSVERAYTANINEPNARSTASQPETDYSSGQYRPNPTGSRSNVPGAASTFGTIICSIVGIVIIFSLIRAIFRGNSGGGGYSGGNYGGTYGSGYGGGGPGYGAGGYGGGGGGGFGRGLLGGLLGGALGSYVENRWENNSGNNSGNQQGGLSSGGGFGGGGGGSSFDSGPSDAGQGFGDSSSGGDFSSGGGGGDSGGGGGSSGGDF